MCGDHATLYSQLKRTGEWALARCAQPARFRRMLADDVVILAYHNIVPIGESSAGEKSLHLSQYIFGQQLDELRSTHEVIALNDLFTRRRTKGGKPRAVITFDDAYSGALTAGVAELTVRRMPATFFVAPGFIPGRSFWWDALASENGILGEDVRARALREHQGDDDIVRVWAAKQGIAVQEPPAFARAGTLRDLETAAGLPGITYGSHTWSHCDLGRVSADRAMDELTTSLGWLQERFRNVIPWLSYPYGSGPTWVSTIAGAAGYDGALRIAGGLVRTARVQRYAVPRVNVAAALSANAFKLRVSGLITR